MGAVVAPHAIDRNGNVHAGRRAAGRGDGRQEPDYSALPLVTFFPR
jgi:hypothetical protein